MYVYDAIDQRLVDERVAQFRDQTRRFLDGRLSEDDFRPLRLQNGLYIQRHAPMLRVAIPYGCLSSKQLRRLARIARRYDRGYGHFSTRQNIQFNWPSLEQAPDILGELADVQMHAIQTSGNCVRNITCDHFAGIAPDEIVDPLVWCELLRQWSTFHPEFAYLPRKFKIAISGSPEDRAAVYLHDIGLLAVRDPAGQVGFRVVVGGGMGRTPIVGQVIREFLPWSEVLNYTEAILRVYNRYGRRDNKYKARIKILVRERTGEKFAADVEAEWRHLAGGPSTVTGDEVDRIAANFTRPAWRTLPEDSPEIDRAAAETPAFAAWLRRNVHAHRAIGYAAVTLSLKSRDAPPGDATAEQMESVADLADRFGFGELRVTHEQNLLLPDVERGRLFELWGALRPLGLATPNAGLITNIIACPGGDFCSLANARSLPVAHSIQQAFDDLDFVHDIGELDLNISGCINSCGHHHVGHIGILGVDKNGAEFYQVTIGGHQGGNGAGRPAAIGRIVGPSFSGDEVAGVVRRLIACYLEHRDSEAERFVDTVHRLGLDLFKERAYERADHRPDADPRPLEVA
jgi:sulfite reductase (NADPH) hemoprotein beta-component